MSESNVFVGVDLHKEFFNYVMVSSSGQKLGEGRRSTLYGDVADFAGGLTGSHRIVLEPLGNCFWFIDILRPYAGAVHLANPYKIRLIAESRTKNDRIDAWILADLLRVGYLPEVYIPSQEIIGWRSMVHHRVRLVRDRSSLKNRVTSLITREGQRVEATDPFGRKGRMQLGLLDLRPATRDMVIDYLAGIDLLTLQIKKIDDDIKEIGSSDQVIELLRTIDGLDYFSAFAVRATTGEIGRFKLPKAYASYTGLIPGFRQSGDQRQGGHITRQGVNVLRWVLIQAVPHAVRRSDYLKRLYQRICFRSSVGKARVAVAHALSRIIWHVWTEERPYYR